MTHPEGPSREQGGGWPPVTQEEYAEFLYLESQIRPLTDEEKDWLKLDANRCRCTMNMKGQMRRFKNCPIHGKGKA